MNAAGTLLLNGLTMPIRDVLEWDLADTTYGGSGEPGSRRIYAQVRDAAGTGRTSSATGSSCWDRSLRGYSKRSICSSRLELLVRDFWPQPLASSRAQELPRRPTTVWTLPSSPSNIWMFRI